LLLVFIHPFDDKLIINRKDTMSKINNLLEELSKSEKSLDQFGSDPIRTLFKYDIINDKDISNVDKNAAIDSANSIFFLFLSNPKLREWMNKYQQQMIEKYGNTIDPSKIDREKIGIDLVNALSANMDPTLLKSIFQNSKFIKNSMPRGFAVADFDVVIEAEAVQWQ